MIQDICTWYKVRMEIPNLLYVQCIYRAMHENYERGRREMRERESRPVEGNGVPLIMTFNKFSLRNVNENLYFCPRYE